MEYADRLTAELPKLYRFARKLTGNTSAAEDLVQETLLKALQSPPRDEEEKGLIYWLFRVLHNLYRDDCRRKRTANRAIEGLVAQAPLIAPPNQELVCYANQIGRQIKALPAEQAALLLNGAAMQLTYKEIAARSGLTLGTVRSRMSRARLALRQTIDTAPSVRVPAAHCLPPRGSTRPNE